MALFRVGLPFVLLTCSLSCLMVHFLPFYIPPLLSLSFTIFLDRLGLVQKELMHIFLSFSMCLCRSCLRCSTVLSTATFFFKPVCSISFKKTGPVWNKILKERRFFTFLVSFLTAAPLFRSNPVYEDNSRVTDHCFRNNSFVIGDSS